MTIAELNTLNTNVKPDSPFNNPVFHAAEDIGVLSWTIAPEQWSVISNSIYVEEIAERFLAYTVELSKLGEIEARVDDILHAYNMYKGNNIYTPIYRIRELLKFYTNVLLHY